MNTQNINLLRVVSKTTTVNTASTENTATVINLKKVFTSADLWNIHRNGRTSFDRRSRA
jgi:hypothetical protein